MPHINRVTIFDFKREVILIFLRIKLFHLLLNVNILYLCFNISNNILIEKYITCVLFVADGPLFKKDGTF